jgi:hypothetical protein
MKKSIHEITLYDLASCEHEVWLSENSKFGLNIELEDENGDVFEEQGLHPCAAEGLADFCKSYLRTYERLNRDD